LSEECHFQVSCSFHLLCRNVEQRELECGSLGADNG